MFKIYILWKWKCLNIIFTKRFHNAWQLSVNRSRTMMSTICHDHWAVQKKLFLDGWKSMVVVIPTCCQHLNKSWVKPNPRLSLSFLNVTRRYKDKNGKEYTKILQSGCGVSCQKQLGSPDLGCPSCKKFTWHRPCLERAFQQRGFTVLCGKAVKTWKYSFRLQKGVEIWNEFDFWKHQTLIINQSALGYRVISPWKYLQCITCFSLLFYAEKL